MSYKEAKKDGIRMEKSGKNPYGHTFYYPPCRFCGTEVRTITYFSDRIYSCVHCRKHRHALLKTGLFK
jgi:hypothetical protein